MTNALIKLSRKGIEFTHSQISALSPYLTRHIKRFGEYIVDLSNIPAPLELNLSIPIREEVIENK